jgi:hypothetical protein
VWLIAFMFTQAFNGVLLIGKSTNLKRPSSRASFKQFETQKEASWGIYSWQEAFLASSQLGSSSSGPLVFRTTVKDF